MRKQFLKIVTLLVFTAVAISSCSVEYREHRKSMHGHPADNDRHYEKVQRY